MNGLTVLQNVAEYLAKFYGEIYDESFELVALDWSECTLRSRSGRVQVEIYLDVYEAHDRHYTGVCWACRDDESDAQIYETPANIWVQVKPEGEQLVGYEFETEAFRTLARQVAVDTDGFPRKILPVKLMKEGARRVIQLPKKLYVDFLAWDLEYQEARKEVPISS